MSPNKIATAFFLFLTIISHFPSTVFSQTTKGKDFWLGFIENAAINGVLKIFISSSVNTSGTVSIPLASWSMNFSVTANTSTTIPVPSNLGMAIGSEIIQDKGIHVVANDSVTVFAMNYGEYSSDASIVLPVPETGTEYFTVNYIEPSNGINDLLIVANEDSTTVEITPKAKTTGGKPANVPFTVMLMAGEVYQVSSTGFTGGDLTGSRIKGISQNNGCKKKIAVFSGTYCVYIPYNCGYCDHAYEQMLPVGRWGREYLSVPLSGKSYDLIRVVAAANGTIFTINGGSPVSLNAGEFYETTLSTPGHFSSNLPVNVAQFCIGTACDGADGDPSLLMLNPLELTHKSVSFHSNSSAHINSHFVNIMTKTPAVNSVKLDGNLIGGFFQPVPSNPSYSYAQMGLAGSGDHTLLSDSGFAAYAYGLGEAESYAFMLGYSNNPPLVISYTSPLCEGNPVGFSVLTKDSVSSWLWNFGDGATDSVPEPVHIFSSDGTYNVSVVMTFFEDCKDTTISVSLSVSQGLSADAGPDVTITKGSSTILHASGGITCVWSPGSGLNDSTLCDPVANPDTTTKYYVTVYDSNGCSSADSVIIYVVEKGSLFIPTVFTPNGDNLNEKFLVYGEGTEEFEMKIFNRWGQQLYFSQEIKEGWDGKNEGILQPSGIYVFMIQGKYSGGENYNYQGTFLLLK